MRRVRRLLVGLLSVPVVVAVLLVVGLSSARTSAARGLGGEPASVVVVPRADLVAVNLRGQELVLTRDGRVARRLPGRAGPGGLTEAIQLAPDRRHAWVSVWTPSAQTFRMFSIDLATGRQRRLADGVSPTLSPNGTELAYIGISMIADGDPGETDLVVENLRNGRTRVIPFGISTVFGDPPELVINWSPDGQQIAVLAGSRYRLVNIRTAVSVVSSAPLPGALLAPVYLNAGSIVADAGCCIGSQQLVTVNLQTGRESKFARLTSPVQTVQRISHATLLITDAGNELARVTQGRVDVLRDEIEAVSP